MGSKRANGEGSIRRHHDGRYEARLTLADGTRKSYMAKTRQEAARRLAEALRDRDKGLLVVPERQTVGQYLDAWLKTIKPTVKPKTYRTYEQLTRVHLLPALGRQPLARLSPQHVKLLWARKLAAGLSPTSVHHLHPVLHKALADALRLGLVQRNVTELVGPPRTARHDMQVLSREQVRRLLDAAREDRLEALYVVAVSTGMRQGELLALKWHDVDLDGGSLQVRATLQKLPGEEPSFTDPKTKQSQRRIALSATASDALRAHRQRQLTERLLLGPAWTDLDLVFPNTIGKPLDGIHLLRRRLHPLLRRAGLPQIRFHDLRHTAATLLLSAGVNPKVVSEMLGHASVAITLDIYSHVLPDMQQQAAAAMDMVLQG